MICGKRYCYLCIIFEVKIMLNDTRPKHVLLCIRLYCSAHYCCANSSQEGLDFLSRCCKLNWIAAVKNQLFKFIVLFLTLWSSNLPEILRISWNTIQLANQMNLCCQVVRSHNLSRSIKIRKPNKQVHMSITVKTDLNSK